MSHRACLISLLLMLVFGCCPAGSLMSHGEGNALSKDSVNEAILLTDPYPIEITGDRYHWHVRYPGADGKLDTADDVTSDRDLHVPLGVEIVLQLKSNDYVYLLSLPQFHLKEAAVPTLDFRLTFRPTTTGEFTLDGDEFCGDPHPELKGRLFVHTRQQFEDWYRRNGGFQSTNATKH